MDKLEKSNIKNDKINKNMVSSPIRQNKTLKNVSYKLINTDLQDNKQRVTSAKDDNNRQNEAINNKNNKKFPRSMSAHQINPLKKENEFFVHNVYLSSRNKLGPQKIFHKKNKNNIRAQRNKLYDTS